MDALLPSCFLPVAWRPPGCWELSWSLVDSKDTKRPPNYPTLLLDARFAKIKIRSIGNRKKCCNSALPCLLVVLLHVGTFLIVCTLLAAGAIPVTQHHPGWLESPGGSSLFWPVGAILAALRSLGNSATSLLGTLSFIRCSCGLPAPILIIRYIP